MYLAGSPATSPADASALLRFLVQTARDAGQLTLGYFGSGIHTDWKDDDTPVTIADRGAERLVRERITAAWPGSDVIGEEFGSSNGDRELAFYIDPIDGTKSFIRGIPTYSVLLAAEYRSRIVASAVYFPALNEMLAAADGMGAWHNGVSAHVSPQTDLGRAFVSHADASSFEPLSRARPWRDLQNSTYYCQGCSDAYGYCLVATGRSDVMLDPIVSPWDTAPWPVIFREAGGWFGSWGGEKDALGPDAVAIAPGIQSKVLSILGS